MNRARCLTILLLVILGNGMIGVHAATHAQTDLGQCELCAAYGDPVDAISNGEMSLPADMRQAHEPGCLIATTATAVDWTYRPRGPPLTA